MSRGEGLERGEPDSAGIVSLRDRVQALANALMASGAGVRVDRGRGTASTIDALLDALEAGAVRAATRDENGHWSAVPWVKQGILAAFRVGKLVDQSPRDSSGHPIGPFSFVDKDTMRARAFDVAAGVRVVAGGTTIRRGAHVAAGVVCMPPAFVNVGAHVGANTMIDSHALIGSCAQVGERVHVSAGAQIGGVLEPVNAAPVIIEDDVVIGGNCGVYEGTVVRARAVSGRRRGPDSLHAGVRSGTRDRVSRVRRGPARDPGGGRRGARRAPRRSRLGREPGPGVADTGRGQVSRREDGRVGRARGVASVVNGARATGVLSVSGEMRVPGDKSVSHRALIFAALADGTSTVRGLLDSADVRSTASALRALGVEVPEIHPAAGDESPSGHVPIRIDGLGLRGLRAPASALDCGNSGTTTRLLAGVCAAYPFRTRFEGDASLSRRPMKRIADPLSAMGARVTFESGDGLPMTIDGGSASRPGVGQHDRQRPGQERGAARRAGGRCARLREGEPRIAGPHRAIPPSAGCDRDGGRLGSVTGATAPTASVRASTYRATRRRRPTSPRSRLWPRVTDRCACRTCSRVRPAERFFETLDGHGRGRPEATAARATDIGEATVTFTVSPGPLRGLDVGADDIPSMIDEMPLLACVAARAAGETRISGAAELRVKESDRIALTVANLRAVGDRGRRAGPTACG